MIQDFNFLFEFLERERINIDRNEFFFQIQSHPDYPSLLAICDTLTFFNIPNIATNITYDDRDVLPDKFMVLLNDKKGKLELCYIERKNSEYFYYRDSKYVEISSKDLESRWNSIILLIEKPANYNVEVKNNHISLILMFIISGLFLINLYQLKLEVEYKIFFVFPILGILLSVVALKDFFGAKNNFINKFCNLTESTSCSAVIESSKWKIFELINFSDLSIVFFCSQVLGFFIFLFWNNSMMFFSIQKLLLLSASPILLLSIYYQKFVERKWCPICLAIALIVIFELTFILFIKNSANAISFHGTYLYVFVVTSVLLCWKALKALLKDKNELKDFQLESLRFKRNYKLFKIAYESQDLIEDNSVEGALVLGNPTAKFKISVVTNPYCSHCKEAHVIIENILEKYGDDIAVNLRFNFNPLDIADSQRKILHFNLIRIYEEKGDKQFLRALHSWFENKDFENWTKQFASIVDEEKVLSILKNQFDWSIRNKLNFTPAIIIDKFHYPSFYERSELEFFIPDLIEEAV